MIRFLFYGKAFFNIATKLDQACLYCEVIIFDLSV